MRTESANREYEQIDQEIETGHLFAGLHFALAHAKDESQAQDIRATLALLLSESRYIQEVLEHYAFDDALTFLAGRAS